ncbi:membrane protein [Tritrichomonas foetus]|uniref:Membrane protein n=1 Tax=Tritrichomonas foetus TaxID=1144522 RepID=A0A1J4KUI0_9EUKA|nr:membrane protein [Tritrichomonas foetus]|eukprot:OHT14927.1 membrane protein [Tritrichomonas foetus]
MTSYHMKFFPNRITTALSRNYLALNVYAFISAFTCYFCMYAFRKPFSVSEFNEIKVFGIEYKILLITLQAIGYTLSKFSGIKIISELNQKNRGKWIIFCILFAEAALILFGLVPQPYNCIFMLLNGLPLGLIWGLVFSFIEGRRTSEILGSGMCVSFIVASGAVKAVGRAVMNLGISQFWMPAVTGSFFFPILVLSVFMLMSMPGPSAEDLAAKTERVTMNSADRIRLLKNFGLGILAMTLFYMTLTAYRDFRDNFAAELWEAFGYVGEPSIFAISEIIVAIIVVIPVGLFMLIKSNINVLVAYNILILSGMVIVAVCALLYQKSVINGLLFMILSGIGLYVAYIPFNSILFDIILSAFQYRANSGFLMYICDSFGYLSSVAILFVKNFAAPKLSWLDFYIACSYIMGATGLFLMLISLVYFLAKYRRWKHENSDQNALLKPDIEQQYTTEPSLEVTFPKANESYT